MSLVLTQRPETTYQSQSIRHVALGNPVIYKFTRKDYITTTVVDSAGNLRVTHVGDLTSVLFAGDELYFRSDNGVYDSYYTVSTVTYSVPNTTITFSGGYTSAATTGFLNKVTLLNYKAVIEVYNTVKLIGTLRVSPDSRGDILVDVSKVVLSDLKGTLEYTYNTESITQAELFKEFYIKYAEIWIGHVGLFTQDSVNLYGVYGSRQIGSKYNGFMNEYVSLSTIVDEKPKFLVTYPPKMWRSMPFSIAAIFDYVYATDFFFEIQRLNSSGGVISSDQTTSANISRRLQTCNIEAMGNITSACTSINIRTNRVTQAGISNWLNIPIENPCEKPVMLRWINSLGGVSWWCFNFNHEYSYEYDDGRKVKRIVLFADNLTIQEWEGINELNSANENYEKPFNELLTSVNRTKKTIGSDVVMHNFIDSEIQIVGQGNDAGNLFFNSSKPHGFSYVDDDIVFINAFYYASPYQADGFYIKDLLTGTIIPYTTVTTFTTAWKVLPPVGVTVVPTSQSTLTRQNKHSIQVTIELPQIFTT